MQTEQIEAMEVEAFYASLGTGAVPPIPEPQEIVRDLEVFGQFIEDYFSDLGGIAIDSSDY